MIKSRLDQNSTGLLHSINLNTKKLLDIKINRKSTSHVAVATDKNTLIEIDSSVAESITIPANVFENGNQFLVSQYGTGQISFVAGTGVTFRSSGNKLKTSAQFSLVTVIAISPTEFYIAGDLTA